MRTICLLMLTLPVHAATAAQFIGPTETKNIEEMVARDPLPPGGNIKAIPLARTKDSATVLVQVRDREPLHYHADADITVSILKGEGTMHIGEKKIPVKAGDVVLVPRGVVHAYVNKGPEVALAVVSYSPAPGPNDRVLVPAR